MQMTKIFFLKLPQIVGFSMCLGGNVPPNSVLFGGTVPSNRVIFGGTVLTNSTSFSDAFPYSNRAMGCDTFVVNILNDKMLRGSKI